MQPAEELSKLSADVRYPVDDDLEPPSLEDAQRAMTAQR
jgi:hypothetical protein